MSPEEPPRVSIIIPVHNDSEGIRATLDSLSEQTHPNSGYEVFVVDNRSTDETPTVVRNCIRGKRRFELLFEDETQSSYAARNVGIAQSSGEILAFIDADVTVDETWVADIVSSMEIHDSPYVGCRVEIVSEQDSLVGEFVRLRGFPVARYLENDRFAPTCCLVVRRHVFDDVGVFDDRLISGGDVEFGHRVFEAGYEQRFEPDVVVYHPARTSLRAVLSKFFRVGRGLGQYRRYHPNQFTKAIWRRPGGYLPPHPLRFYRKTESQMASPSLRKMVMFYLIAYVTRITRTAGAWYQMVLDESLTTTDVETVQRE